MRDRSDSSGEEFTRSQLCIGLLCCPVFGLASFGRWLNKRGALPFGYHKVTTDQGRYTQPNWKATAVLFAFLSFGALTGLAAKFGPEVLQNMEKGFWDNLDDAYHYIFAAIGLAVASLAGGMVLGLGYHLLSKYGFKETNKQAAEYTYACTVREWDDVNEEYHEVEAEKQGTLPIHLRPFFPMTPLKVALDSAVLAATVTILTLFLNRDFIKEVGLSPVAHYGGEASIVLTGVVGLGLLAGGAHKGIHALYSKLSNKGAGYTSIDDDRVVDIQQVRDDDDEEAAFSSTTPTYGSTEAGGF